MGFECYSTLKMKGILTHGTTWVSLGDVLSELRTQSQKAKHCRIPHTRFLKQSSTETESRAVVARGWRKRDGELIFIGYKVSAGKMKKSS